MEIEKNSLPHLFRLQREAKKGHLSSALLFQGPPYSGKRSTALAFASEYLNVKKTLDSPYFSTIGSLPRPEEWKVLSQLYENKVIPLSAIQDFVLFLLRKFQAEFWEMSEIKTKISDADLVSLQDFVTYARTVSATEWKNLESLVLKIMNLYPKSISIAQIRAIKEWAFSLKGQAKFLLIERGETLSIGATNALLKLLEEPPEDFLCILTTDNKGLLPATLLSRLRTFSFSPYGQEETKAIVEKTYHQTTEALDLKTFFDSFNSQEAGKTLSFAQSFYFALQEREPFPQNLEWSGLFENKEMVRPTLELFLRDLLSLWQKRLGEHPQESSLIAELMRELNVQTERAFTFNQSPQTFLEGLYYRLKKIWIFEEGA